MKKSYLLLLLTAFSAFYGCQKDIPLLGQDESGETVITPKSEVFIKAITLRSFPSLNPADSLPWDVGSFMPFDSTDSIGPDIYFNFRYKSDTGLIMSFQQPSHFSDVLQLDPDSPLVYYVIPSFQILPEYIDTTFYLRIYDLEIADPMNDSTLIDSIPFAIGPDFNQPNPYITSISSTGFNGSQVTLELEWK